MWSKSTTSPSHTTYHHGNNDITSEVGLMGARKHSCFSHIISLHLYCCYYGTQSEGSPCLLKTAMCLCACASLVVHVFTVYTLHSHFTGSARYASTYRAESTKHNPPSAAAEEAAGFWVDYRSRQPSLSSSGPLVQSDSYPSSTATTSL